MATSGPSFTKHNPGPTARRTLASGGKEKKGPETRPLLALGRSWGPGGELPHVKMRGDESNKEPNVARGKGLCLTPQPCYLIPGLLLPTHHPDHLMFSAPGRTRTGSLEEQESRALTDPKGPNQARGHWPLGCAYQPHVTHRKSPLTMSTHACFPSMKPLGMEFGVRISYLRRKGAAGQYTPRSDSTWPGISMRRGLSLQWSRCRILPTECPRERGHSVNHILLFPEAEWHEEGLAFSRK